MLLTAALLSIAMHIVAALLIVLLPRVLPREDRPQEPATVELLMVEKKGSELNRQSGPAQPDPEKTPVQERNTDLARSSTVSNPSPAPPTHETGDEAVRSSSEPVRPDPLDPEVKPSADQPVGDHVEAPRVSPSPSQQTLVLDLDGTESESNAVALGAGILPAMRDDRFRNRPPSYPPEAQMRGQHGTVVVVIHVVENGSAAGVDVVESSGVATLDQAAVAAARKWHFHPAMEAGRAVPFDMPFRFVFSVD